MKKRVSISKKILYDDVIMNPFDAAIKEIKTLTESQVEQVMDFVRYLKGLSSEAGSRIVLENSFDNNDEDDDDSGNSLFKI